MMPHLHKTSVLERLLSHPEEVSADHVEMLTEWAIDYPYYQPIHLLLAKAAVSTDAYPRLLASASLYTSGQQVYDFLHSPSFFTPADPSPGPAVVSEEEPEVFEEIADVSIAFSPSPEEQTFEEINELDLSAFKPSSENIAGESLSPEQLPDEMAIGSIVSDDFFAFEKRFVAKAEGAETIIQENKTAEQGTVTKYDDDQLPYTFLWWLAKTRKEHEQIFQPYVSAKPIPPSSEASPLQQQYVEHIFHLQTPFDMGEEAQKTGQRTVADSHQESIIDRFIKNEPQIKTPKIEQLNTENKAKKSAEDNYDLVSETLASIYIEQMLYHKAIDTYQKLSLKFPEKSRYFADLIQSLEKKI